MSSSEVKKNDSVQAMQRRKAARLPSHARIQKRPILHPAIPSPYTSAKVPKVIYLKCSTPFIPTIKRVRRLLGKAEDRISQSSLSTKRKTPLIPKDVEDAIAAGSKGSDGTAHEEIYVKATGKAIEKALNVAVFFQQQRDCRVRIKTGTVCAIDDIVLTSPHDEPEESSNNQELPDSRIRQANSIEVAISLR